MSKISINITRGNIIESSHEAKCIIKNFNNKTIFSTGHENDLIYPRSAIKIFQAIPFIKSNAHKLFKLSKKEIAISCSSHCGEKEHLIILNNWFNKLKIKKTSLKCGIHNPLNLESSNKLLLKGNKPNQLHNNCAGKHMSMISGCISNKFKINDYVNFNHPYQKLIRYYLEFFNECKITKKQIGVDGCSAPQYAFPLKNLSVSMINLIKSYIGKKPYSDEIKILMDSILKYPKLIGGSNNFDTQLMSITKGKIFAKCGAEGVLLFAHIDKKIGGIIKIKDGNARAVPSTAYEIFKKLSLINANEQKNLYKWGNQELYNHANIKIGKINSNLS